MEQSDILIGYKRDEGISMIIFCDMIDSEEGLRKFERLYSLYRRTMYAVAVDVIKDSHEAEDILEESLLKVIGILDDIDEDVIRTLKCKNLMITITKNTAIDHWRKLKRTPSLVEDPGVKDTCRNVEELYIDTENFKELVQCFGELNDTYLDVLKLKIVHQLSSKQIADILNTSEENVNMRFMRAKQMLAKKLEERKKR